MNAYEFIKQYGLDLAHRDIACLESGFITEQDFIEANGFEFEELRRVVESHELVGKIGRLEGCREIIDSAPSDSTHIKINLGLCIYYCQSTGSEGDQAGLWIDDGVGYWGLSSYQNYELSSAENRFILIAEVRKAIADVEACQ